VVLAGALRSDCWPGVRVNLWIDVAVTRRGAYFVELLRFEQFPCLYELVFEDLRDGVERRHLAGVWLMEGKMWRIV